MFASGDSNLPYECYELSTTSSGFFAYAPGSQEGEAFHLYLNSLGDTRFATAAQASALGLPESFNDRGVAFNASVVGAYDFDAEGFLIANKDNLAIKTFVQELAQAYRTSSDNSFIDAVELRFLDLAEVVGVTHGGQGTVDELNSAFGTSFS